MINTTTTSLHLSCCIKPAEYYGLQGINPSSQPGDREPTPAGLEYLCHKLQVEFMTTSRLYFRVSKCILIFQTMQMAKKNSISEVETSHRISKCVSVFFFINCQDAVKFEDHWLLFTQKVLITAIVPVHHPNILKQTRFILEWEFGKQSALQSGQAP